MYCRSHDRFRWCFYLLEHETTILTDTPCTVLHMAPEPQIAARIEQYKNCTYYTGDIVPGRAKEVVDVTDMQFQDSFFDYIIMNHVLEHIPDEKKAISELMRCLKPNGVLILSFPVCTDQKTVEDPNIISPKDRLRHYGQEDHCRLYGTDSVEHLQSYGLKIVPYVVQDVLPPKEVQRMALIPNDVIYFCRKS